MDKNLEIIILGERSIIHTSSYCLIPFIWSSRAETKSQTWLSDFTFHFHALEKEMATHSSILAWRTPGTGEPGHLLSMGLHRVGHDWSDLATAAAAEEKKLIYVKKIRTLVTHEGGSGGQVQLESCLKTSSG